MNLQRAIWRSSTGELDLDLVDYAILDDGHWISMGGVCRGAWNGHIVRFMTVLRCRARETRSRPPRGVVGSWTCFGPVV